jgi:hypothetical protein
MRTHAEFLAEARRVGMIGESYADEHRRMALQGQTLGPRNIPTFLAAPTSPHERWVEVEMIEGSLEYRLMESAGSDHPSQAGSVIRFASDSAFDLLVEGDEIAEKEQLLEALAPLVERIEKHEFDAAIEPAVVEEVEALLDAGELEPTERMRTKAEIVEFLAGHVEPSALVARAVERRSERQALGESLAHRCDDRRVVEQL